MNNFTDRLIEIEKEAREFIFSKVKDGQTIELVTEEQIAESENEILYELPQVNIINKYDESCTYAIVSIDKNGMAFDLKGIGINSTDTYIFTPYELTASEICFIADYLK